MPKLRLVVQVDIKAWKEEGEKGPTCLENKERYEDWPIPEIHSSWAMEATENCNFFRVEDVIHFPDAGYVEVILENMEPSHIRDLLDSNTGWSDPDAK